MFTVLWGPIYALLGVKSQDTGKNLQIFEPGRLRLLSELSPFGRLRLLSELSQIPVPLPGITGRGR